MKIKYPEAAKLDMSEVISFGCNVQRNTKEGLFSGFKTVCWIKYLDGRIILFHPDYSIAKLRKHLPIVEGTSVHYEDIKVWKGKSEKRTATAWEYIIKGEKVSSVLSSKVDKVEVNNINDEILLYTGKIHSPTIKVKNVKCYFIFLKIYRNSITHEYLYCKEDDSIINTNLYGGKASREELIAWVKNYEKS